MAQSSTNQIINPHQLQSQFQTLHTLKTNLSHQILTTDNLRTTEQQTLLHLRQSYRQTEEKYRLASSNAGTSSKKRTMLNQEIRRLESVLKGNGNKLKELSGEVIGVEGERREKKFEFVKEMEGCNDEMGDAVRRFGESELFGNVLGVESCSLLIQFLEQKVDQHGIEHGNGHGNEDGQWKKMLDTMRNTAEQFKGATDTLHENKKQHANKTDKASALRQAVQMQNTEALGDAELDELERLWEQSPSLDADCNYTSAGGDMEVDGVDEHVGNDDRDRGDNQVYDTSPDTDTDTGLHQHQHQPTNMHLFYGDELYGNAPANPAFTDDAARHDHDHGVAVGDSSMIHQWMDAF